jgi:hypothetical protein
MGALPVPQLRPVTEVEVLQTIGQIANTATSEVTGLREMLDAMLCLPGVDGVKIEDGALLAISGQFARPQRKGHATLVNVSANGRFWGRLRLSGDDAIESSGRFLGQQLALLLNRLELMRERDVRRAQAKRLSERLEARKNLHRASGLVAKTRGVPNQQALQILVRHARKTRRTLNRVAETVLLGYEAPLSRRPVSRERGR